MVEPPPDPLLPGPQPDPPGPSPVTVPPPDPAQRMDAPPPGGPLSTTVNARDPSDLSRLLWYLVVVGVGLLAALGAEQTTAGIEGDLVQVIGRVPEAFLGFFIVGVEVLHLMLFLGIPLFLLVTRQFRRWGIYTLAFVTTTVVFSLASRAVTPSDAEALADIGINADPYTRWPPSQSVATAVTVLVLLTPHLNRAWRQFGWTFVAVLAALNIVTSPVVVLDLVLAVGIGGTVGCLALLLFGRQVQVPTVDGVMAGLDRIDLTAVELVEAPYDTRGAVPFRGELADGTPVHCKVLTPAKYEADSLLRTYRRFRVRGLGEDVAFSTVRRAAAVEAGLARSAAAAGVTTPAVLGVAPLGREGRGTEMAIAFEEITGSNLGLLAEEQLTDEVLDQAWQAVARMRSVGIAHRDLRLASWLLADDGTLWLTGFSFGETGATDGALSVDIAELLAATYPVVGADRAVAAAVRVLGAPVVATGISHLVPAALTRSTRSAAKKAEDGLDPLIHATAQACAVEEPKLAAIERVKPRTLITAAMLAFAVYALLPQLTDLPQMIDAIRAADPLLALAALVASLATYVGSSMTLSGSLPIPVRQVHAFLASVAATFVGAVAPPGVAQIGVNVRFAQKQGLSSPVAVSATAAKEVAIVVVHVVLLILVAIAAGSSGALEDELERLPSWRTVVVFVTIALLAVAVAFAIRRVRQLFASAVIPALKQSVGAMRDIAANPAKVLTLFVGALLLQSGYITALYFSVHALGGDIPLATIGLIYLTVGSAATFAPTPGGLGAVEAVLLAALTGVGMPAAAALAATFLYRLVTFWLPIPAGALAFRSLVSRDLL